VARGIDEADGPLELSLRSAGRAGRGHAVALGLVAAGALVDGAVGVAELDGDASLQLLTVARRPDASERLDQGGLAVVDVADGADVYLRLTG